MHPKKQEVFYIITNMDFSILEFISNNLRCGVLDALMPQITRLADDGIFWIMLALVLMIFQKTRRFGIAMIIAMVLDLLLCNVTLKPLVGRPRPFALRDVTPLISPPGDFSFPSGHTAVSFAAAGALTFYKAPGRVWALVLAAVIGFSRLYLYVHYPTDVLGGIAVGLLCGWIGVWLTKRLPRRGKNRDG